MTDYERGYKDGMAGAALPNIIDNGDKIDGYNYSYKTDSEGVPYINIDCVRAMLTKAAKEMLKMADNTFNEELLIGAFGTLCDFLVDMQLCARDCPYSGNRNEDGECNAWQVINDIRSKRNG